ncbi:MAG: sugar ABC transporter ATP-binding protein [Mesorhizobium sp.]|uniref:sugar ABC transporter ATP-binding protein n=1 Tax=Mesorhizobium sp. TaxID=1871066 RepID=UPI0011F6CCB7|nr:sugar ABC transporter ATP-binding protein [Mesorhizobium sp.]TIN95516.1 MAG: sugar ABC transporter ATP-binding protein [Mesorhizobium sp.]TJU97163.1 MAG: sugar ABC transporter ATP-binding protein [Mesorhizobium sp.]
MAGVTKRFGLATVLDAVSFELRRGEVHAIVGENGAGKSTLARVLSGFVEPDGGTVTIDGEGVTRFSVQEAEKRGIILIHQELALAEHLNVADNMFLGHELHRGSVLAIGEMSRLAGEMLGRLGCPVSPAQTVSTLPVSDRQMVEIAKALLRKARLIIMDEPTAVLTPREAENLFTQVERLRSEGVAIVYVSHKLEEVKRIADRVTVLRDGKYQGTWSIETVTTQDIANLMVGRELSQIYPAKAATSAEGVVLRVRDFAGETSRSPVNLDLCAGEILGVAGLVGSGRTELFETLVGLRRCSGGQLLLRDRSFRPANYHDALAAGVVYITEDRKGRGLLLDETIALNVSFLDQILARFWLVDRAREQRSREWAMREFSIEAPYPNVRVGSLSGGNQQKVLLAKSLLNNPGVIVIDEPTRGIDVGTRAQIYRMLRRLADAGNAVVVISSDMQEIIGLSDRVMVMRDQSVVAFLGGPDITEEKIVQHVAGVATISGGEK